MIYLVYDYEEHGPTNLVATTDYTKIKSVINRHFDILTQRSNPCLNELYNRFREEALATLASLEYLNPGEYQLTSGGWGCSILEIVQDI